MSFLPQDYTAPASSKNYMKFEEGDNKFRALSAPTFGYEWWEGDGKDRKPKRVKTYAEVPGEAKMVLDKREAPKFFWAFLVWNYKTQSAQLLEITQKGIQKSLESLDKDADWGDLRDYDVAVTKTGAKLETEYLVNPKPKVAFDRNGKTIPSVNLEALFTGEDPFMSISQSDLDSISAEIK